MRELDTLGAILDKAVTVGANTINGVTFSVADPSELYDEARRPLSPTPAPRRALCAAAGGELDDSSRSLKSQGYNPAAAHDHVRHARRGGRSAVPVEAGELSFSINVTVQWEFAERHELSDPIPLLRGLGRWGRTTVVNRPHQPFLRYVQ